jgi:hypothetical protein
MFQHLALGLSISSSAWLSARVGVRIHAGLRSGEQEGAWWEGPGACGLWPGGCGMRAMGVQSAIESEQIWGSSLFSVGNRIVESSVSSPCALCLCGGGSSYPLVITSGERRSTTNTKFTEYARSA